MSKSHSTVAFLRAVAAEGLPERRIEREALADILEIALKTSARLEDYLNRADVLLSQSAAKGTADV